MTNTTTTARIDTGSRVTAEEVSSVSGFFTGRTVTGTVTGKFWATIRVRTDDGRTTYAARSGAIHLG